MGAAIAAAMAAAAPPGGAGGPPPAGPALAQVIQQAVTHALQAMALPPPVGGPPPPPPAAGGGVPPPGAPPPPVVTYHTLVEEAGLQDYHTAKYMYDTFRDTAWPVALTPSANAVTMADPPDGNIFLSNQMNMNALAPKFYLIVMNNHVQVAYGMCPCPELTNPTTRAYWLSGDYSKLANGVVVYPKMFRSHGAINAQFTNFERTLVPAMLMTDIRAAYAADPALALTPGLQVAADGTLPPEVSVWRAFPVHQKIACLFMTGVPVRDALETVFRLVETIPPAHRPSADGLVDWIRAAATSNGAAAPNSCLNSNAVRLDTATTPEVEEWFYNVVTKYAPRGAAGPPPAGLQPPVPPQAPMDARLVEILDLLQKSQTSGALASSEGKAYMPHELNVLFMVSGQPAPWSALTEAQLPEVFQQLRPFRKTTAATRLFLERFLAASYPSTATTTTSCSRPSSSMTFVNCRSTVAISTPPGSYGPMDSLCFPSRPQLPKMAERPLKPASRPMKTRTRTTTPKIERPKMPYHGRPQLPSRVWPSPATDRLSSSASSFSTLCVDSFSARPCHSWLVSTRCICVSSGIPIHATGPRPSGVFSFGISIAAFAHSFSTVNSKDSTRPSIASATAAGRRNPTCLLMFYSPLLLPRPQVTTTICRP